MPTKHHDEWPTIALFSRLLSNIDARLLCPDWLTDWMLCICIALLCHHE